LELETKMTRHTQRFASLFFLSLFVQSCEFDPALPADPDAYRAECANMLDVCLSSEDPELRDSACFRYMQMSTIDPDACAGHCAELYENCIRDVMDGVAQDDSAACELFDLQREYCMEEMADEIDCLLNPSFARRNWEICEPYLVDAVGSGGPAVLEVSRPRADERDLEERVGSFRLEGAVQHSWLVRITRTQPAPVESTTCNLLADQSCWINDQEPLSDLRAGQAVGWRHSVSFSGFGEYLFDVQALAVRDGQQDSDIERIRFFRNDTPRAVIEVTAQQGPGEYLLDGRASSDQEDGIVSFSWTVEPDGRPGQARPIGAQNFISYRFPESGIFRVRLTVTDRYGAEGTADQRVDVELPRKMGDFARYDDPISKVPSQRVYCPKDKPRYALEMDEGDAVFLKKNAQGQFVQTGRMPVENGSIGGNRVGGAGLHKGCKAGVVVDGQVDGEGVVGNYRVSFIDLDTGQPMNFNLGPLSFPAWTLDESAVVVPRLWFSPDGTVAALASAENDVQFTLFDLLPRQGGGHRGDRGAQGYRINAPGQARISMQEGDVVVITVPEHRDYRWPL